jgi:uncharacterized protein (TIGR02391 family)
MDWHSYHYRFCRSGHLLYSPFGEITQKRCESCGQPYLVKCESCGTPVRDTFDSRHYSHSIRPIAFPSKPSHCRECGTAFPWIEKPPTAKAPKEFWATLHPKVVEIARPRFESGHFADAVEAALKELNAVVKRLYREKTGEDRDGVDLMHAAFSPKKPAILLGDLDTETGRSMQQGYMEIFAGAIAGIRNPKAHENIEIDDVRAIHHLFVASLLFSKIDEKL